jgi:hypothetical protein
MIISQNKKICKMAWTSSLVLLFLSDSKQNNTTKIKQQTLNNGRENAYYL